MRHFSGEFTGIRLLMTDELEAISGGDGEDTDDVIIEEVFVVAKPLGQVYYVPFQPWWSSGGGGTATYSNPEAEDASTIHVDLNIARTLSPDEQAAVNSLTSAITRVSQAINNLANSSQVTLPNGQTVTGFELKLMWSRADFNINEAGTVYGNGTMRGEAAWNSGDPEVSFNIDLLKDYNSFGAGSMNFLVLHELGHMTGAGRASNGAMYTDGVVTAAEFEANEQLAHDIARAIGFSNNMAITNPTAIGFSTANPLTFVP